MLESIDLFLDNFLSYFIEFVEIILFLAVFGLANLFIYDRYVQRKHQLLINYPVIGRFRYLFEALREPLRQYFAEEKFYESRDKVEWVYKAAKNLPNFMSFSVSQPFSGSRFIIKHSPQVLNDSEVDNDFSVVFGKNRPIPFRSKSPIIRSAMSDGALSPEAVRAFTLGATLSNFTINTGEGGLTSNYFFTHRPDLKNAGYLEIVKSTPFAQLAFKLVTFFFNRSLAVKVYRKLLLHKKTENTYIYDPVSHSLFRVNWSAPIEEFPKEVPADMPDLILQIGSGLYGVRDKEGNFDEKRYEKAMRFCRMTEIKIAQGAKQTGGKLVGSKVTADIAYYRGVEEGKDLISPNRFPYAKTTEELLDFVGKLQDISKKPVGIKIVISDAKSVEDLVYTMHKRKEEGKAIVDFITVDSGDGGSATAPLELMESVGLTTPNALYVLDTILRRYNLREDVSIIVSGKILTPDDVVIALSLGADAVGIARGFMMSGGCIRARKCAGTDSHVCPVGMATQDPKRRASYLVVRKGKEIANYHTNLLKGIKTLLAVMGVKHIKELDKKHLTYKNRLGEIYFDVDNYFHQKLHI
ncbi:FMN-binding glutamate synthase family protein [Nitrosophilus alvini]|uniref:FMN-binding glutamate synthase family protein n=1 Tax=Nitrosophilus alvini TaxID=2714855 RepID=UPI00190D9057|nr:FMN-binding glutamate synthase family protein [Nitrosophilus alvini]